jgi:hypothetical protein
VSTLEHACDTAAIAKIDDMYGAADDYDLVTSAEARALGVSGAEVVRYEARGRLERAACTACPCGPTGSRPPTPSP